MKSHSYLWSFSVALVSLQNSLFISVFGVVQCTASTGWEKPAFRDAISAHVKQSPGCCRTLSSYVNPALGLNAEQRAVLLVSLKAWY